VVEATSEGMITSSGEIIKADLRVWAAGVKAPDFLHEIGGLETNRNNQLMVRSTLQTTEDDRIFAMGDCCYFVPEGQLQAVPPRAQAAHQMANIVATNIRRLIKGRSLVPFRYRDHGSLVSLSRYSTVGSLMGNLIGGRLAIEGRLARLVYISLYQMHLLAIHGILKGVAQVIVSQINHTIRPRLKLH
jgi:NADH dehydrogenase